MVQQARPDQGSAALLAPDARADHGRAGASCSTASERVLLVRHGYRPGWHFPGGGVEKGETVAVALARELEEEAGVTLSAAAAAVRHLRQLRQLPRRPHRALRRARLDAGARAARPTREIREQGFFAADALPRGTSDGTRRRIAEVLGGAPRSETW